MDECLTCGFNRGNFCFVTEFNKERMKMGGWQDKKPEEIAYSVIREADKACGILRTKSEELADDHWNYVAEVLMMHGVEEYKIDMVGFHYRSAFEHGYKHGVADASA